MPDTTECPFIFVPDGAPWPWEWVHLHPQNLVLPARFEGPAGLPNRSDEPSPSSNGTG